MRRLLTALLIIILAVIGLWVAALVFLPEAPRGQAKPNARSVALGGPLAMPVAGMSPGALRDSWGDPRDNGLRAHHGTDIPRRR